MPTTKEVTVSSPSEREILMRAASDRAAAAFDALNDRHSQRIADLEEKLKEALTVLEGRNARIEVLERAMEEDRDHFNLELSRRDSIIESYRAIRDDALHERDQLRVVFHSLRAQLDALELPLRPPSRAEDRFDEGYTNGPVETGHA
jgi:chromosome segregation ATPase